MVSIFSDESGKRLELCALAEDSQSCVQRLWPALVILRFPLSWLGTNVRRTKSRWEAKVLRVLMVFGYANHSCTQKARPRGTSERMCPSARRQDLIFCLNELLKLQVGCLSCSAFTGQVANFLGQRSGIYNVQREVTFFGHTVSTTQNSEI